MVSVIIQSKVYGYVAYAVGTCTVSCTYAIKNEGVSFNKKNYNMKFVSVTNEKATSKFHVPVQTPAFPCSQRSQGAVMC